MTEHLKNMHLYSSKNYCEDPVVYHSLACYAEG